MKAETHLASWQVICPDGAYAGGVAVAPPIVMAQAVDQSVPVPTVMAQAMDPSASVPLGVVMPPQQQMGTAMAQPMVMAPQGVAPVNNTMARGPMDGRMSEVSSGCYYHKNAPCCFIGYYSFNEDRSTCMIGPVFCCCVCCCPCPPGCCGNQNAVSQGSSVYKGDAGVDVWQSPTEFTRTSAYGDRDAPYVKC